MAKSLDTILVIDIESTCWDGEPPNDETTEIIEVGLCTVDVKSLTRRKKRSILIKPIQSQISNYCTQLTTLTPDMFHDAGSLEDATRILRNELQSKNRLWASWGDYDRRQFERACAKQNVDYPFGPSHLNVKSLFAVTTGSNREMGLDAAFRHLNLTMEGTHHRGDDDAWNIADILYRLLQPGRTSDLLS